MNKVTSIEIEHLLETTEDQIDKLLEHRKTISVIDKDGNESEYVIINTTKDLAEYKIKLVEFQTDRFKSHLLSFNKETDKKTEEQEKQPPLTIINIDLGMGPIETTPHYYPAPKNFHDAIKNTIFMKSVHISESDPINYAGCIFKEGLVILSNKEKKSEFKVGATSFANCDFYKDIKIYSNCSKVYIKDSCFFKKSSIRIQKSSNSLHIEWLEVKNCTGQKHGLNFIATDCSINIIQFYDCNIEKFQITVSDIKKLMIVDRCSTTKDSSISLYDVSLFGRGRFKLDNANGKIKIHHCNLNRFNFYMSEIKKQKYQPLIVADNKKINLIKTIDNLSSFYELSIKEPTKEHQLDLEYLEKKYFLQYEKESKNINILEWAIKKTAETLFAYFCRWPRILGTMIMVIFIFTGLYLFNPDSYGLVTKTPESCTLITEDQPVSSWFIAYNALYFSIITFTTVGYGDFHPEPDSLTKIIPAMEGLLGVVLISCLVAALIRRYSR